MAFAPEPEHLNAFRVDKPSGIPTFNGWDGKPLRVPSSEYEARLDKVCKAMEADSSMDVVIIVQPEDIYYLTGFYTIGDSAPQSLILAKGRPPFMVARLIEVDQAKNFSWIAEVWTCADIYSTHDVFCQAISAVLPEKGVVGIQHNAISASHCKRLCQFFEQHKGLVLKDASKLVEDVRLQKSEYEQQCIQKASVATEVGIKAGLKLIKADVLLSDLYKATNNALIDAGSEVPSYAPIVRSIHPSGHGSWVPGERAGEGNLVFLEASACIHGHHSPIMRTAYIMGPEDTQPPAWLKEAGELIRKVFSVCLPMMVPGAIASDIDRVGREIMESNHFGLKMAARLAYTAGGTSTQPTGHAGWGDADFSLVGHNHQPLRDGMVFHFIPWFQKYDEPSGPIGLSDAIIVTKAGGRRFGSMPLDIAVLRPDGSLWGQPRNVDLRSDTMTLPTAEMRTAMAEAELGDDVFGEDPTVKKLECQAAQMFDKEAALFFPTGTMGNLASIMVHCDTRDSEVILGSMSHVHVWEQGGVSSLGGIHPRVIAQKPDGTIDLDEVENAIRVLNDHFPTSKVLVLEQTHNMTGGRALPMDYIDQAAALCRRHGLKLHIDGARIFNACAALDVSPKRMLRDVDSASVCLSKGLASPVGSFIVGSAEFVRKARRSRKVLGGGMRQVGVLAACGLVSLDHMAQAARIKEDHRRAKSLAIGLAELPNLDVRVDEVESNIVMINTKQVSAHDLVDRLKEMGTFVLANSSTRIRAVTFYQVDDEAIGKAISDFKQALTELATGDDVSGAKSKKAKLA